MEDSLNVRGEMESVEWELAVRANVYAWWQLANERFQAPEVTDSVVAELWILMTAKFIQIDKRFDDSSTAAQFWVSDYNSFVAAQANP